ncbi:MAG: hypothetical protein HKN15_13405 [Xanthomonadales bacterium]|nr:hypothetical protein [Xanthomonadales bacterium]
MYVNYERALDASGRLTEFSYATLAHELVHTVDSNTPYGRSSQACRVNEWINEGIADALAYDMAEELWEGKRYRRSHTNADIAKRWGVRPYTEPLVQENSRLKLHVSGAEVLGAYGTSSFFRYIADSYSRGWKVLYSTDSGTPELWGLWQRPLASGNRRDWQREVDWLDEGLKAKFGIGLSGVYGLFINSYSHRVPPFGQVKGMSPEDKLDWWVPRIFGECESINISLVGHGTATFDLKQLGSACFWVEPTKRPGLAQITFSAASDDQSFLGSLSIGRADTTLLQRAKVIHTPGLAQEFQTDWRDFPQDGEKRTLYLISNIASKPSRTRPGTVTIRAALPGYETSLTKANLFPSKVAPAPTKAEEKRHAPRLSEQRNGTRKMLEQQAKLDKDSLNDRVSGATRLQRQTRVLGCTQPFVYEACGPRTTVQLELRPGTYMQVGQASADGGEAAQAFGSLMTIATSNPMKAQKAMVEYDARLQQVDGHAITLEFPLIDYGDTGMFTNAEIRVQMSGNRTFRAIAPPDASGRTRLTGTVSIEEYTPMAARGTFEGGLAEMAEAADGSLVYHERQRISGRFSTVSPYRDDPRIEKEKQPEDEIAQDIANALGISAESLQSMRAKGLIPSSSGSTAGAGAAAAEVSSDGECSCECEARATADELCAFYCEEEFAACDGP